MKYPIVKVEWDDAFHLTESWLTGGQIVNAYREKRFRVENVGWLLYEDKKYVILAAKHSEDWEDFGHTIMIPKGMIVKKTKL